MHTFFTIIASFWTCCYANCTAIVNIKKEKQQKMLMKNKILKKKIELLHYQLNLSSKTAFGEKDFIKI